MDSLFLHSVLIIVLFTLIRSSFIEFSTCFEIFNESTSDKLEIQAV